MARTPSLKDPVEYLKNRVVQNGCSGADGTYLIGANVVVDPTAHAHSDTQEDAISFLVGLVNRDEKFSHLVARLAVVESPSAFYHIPDYFGHFGCSLHLLREADTLFLVAVLSDVQVEEFDEDVEFLSHFALWFSRVAGCKPGKLRVVVTRATLSWERMEEDNLLYPIEHESN